MVYNRFHRVTSLRGDGYGKCIRPFLVVIFGTFVYYSNKNNYLETRGLL